MLGVKLKGAMDTLGEVLLVYLVILLIAATMFSFIENKSFIDSLYWAGITGPSVGYGDVTPQTVGGKILSVVFAHISLFLIVPLFTARLAMRLIVDNDTFTHDEQTELFDKLTKKEELLTQILQELKNK